MDTNYFQTVKKDEKTLPDVLKVLNEEYDIAKEEVCFKSKNLTKCVSELASNFDKRLVILNEIEAILKHFEIKLSQKRSEKYKVYLTKYQRALTSSDIKAYIDGEEDIVALQQIINEIALVRNKYLSLTKAFETANFQLSNLSKLYVAGIDNVIL